MKLKILVLILVMVVAGCGSGGDNGVNSGESTVPVVITEASNKAAYDKAMLPLNDIYTRYNDARTIAGATPRIALATPLNNMQSIKREADTLVVAKCLDFAKSMLTGGMLNVNAAYVDFMQQGSSVSFLMNLGDTAFTRFEVEIAKQNLCDFSIM